MKFWVLSLALFCALPLSAQTVAGAPVAEAHTQQAHIDAIRRNKLKHLEARLYNDAADLKAQCRYESEISSAPPAGKVALTFDDGPEPGLTEAILETLRRHQVPATFFLIGRKAEEHPDLVQRIRDAGIHRLGNHSWDHPNFHDLPVDAQASEVLRTREVLAKTGGAVYFRYPFGNSSCETNAMVKQLGYEIVGWHVDTCDWAFDHTGSVDPKEALICGVLPQHQNDYVGHVLASVRAHNGGIVLMHEIHPHTVAQLEQIIVELKHAGYAFVALDDAGFVKSLR